MKAKALIFVCLVLILFIACQKEAPLAPMQNKINSSITASSIANGNYSITTLSSNEDNYSEDNYSIVFGPEKFYRKNGKAVYEIKNFNAQNTTEPDTKEPGRLVLVNGDSNKKKRVSSAEIILNDERILEPDDFNNEVDRLKVEVNLLNDNELKVKLNGKPGSFVEITVFQEINKVLLFKDDFENIAVGDYPDENGWQNLHSGVTSYVTDEASFSGDKSFKLVGRPYWARTEIVSIPNVSKIEYNFNALIPSPANSWPKVGLYKYGWSTWGWMFPTIRFDRVIQKIFAYGVPNPAYERVEIANWTPDQWYTVKVVADFTNKTMDITIDGNEYTDIALNDYSNYDHFLLATGGHNEPGNSTIFVDNIAIYQLLDINDDIEFSNNED